MLLGGTTNYTNAWGLLNDLVLYPDEAFIVAKRTNGTLEMDFEGSINCRSKITTTSGQ